MSKANLRKDEEASEGLSSVSNSAPSSKFQTDQQVAESAGSTILHTDAEREAMVVKTTKPTGSQLKQEVASGLVKSPEYVGGYAGDGSSFGATRSGGSVGGGVLGTSNATPIAGRSSRSDARVSKKLDRQSSKLNFIPNEQVLVEWDESKPLAAAKDSDQGYNGTYRNEFARSQKTQGNVPGELMFDRSVDLLIKDNVYFGQGQYIAQTGSSTAGDCPTKTAVLDEDGEYVNPDSDNFDPGYGDYLTVSMDIGYDDNGERTYTIFTEEDLTPTPVTQAEANQSSVQALTHRNDAELVREVIDSKAGDEKADIWSPLARAVAQPTQTVGYLRDVEAETGNELMTAYRKATTSMAYQINRAHKDGQDDIVPGIDALTGVNRNYVSRKALIQGEGSSIEDLFNPEVYAAGSPALLIAAYDSPNKYKRKADLLIQPRGLRMHLQTADNNIDPFYVNALFAKAYDASETFSTIGHEYDPMAPVCMTDKAGVVHRLSWAKQANFFRPLKIRIDSTSTGSGVTYSRILLSADAINAIKANGYSVYIGCKHDSVQSGQKLAYSATRDGNTGNYVGPTNNYSYAGYGSGEKFFALTIGPASSSVSFTGLDEVIEIPASTLIANAPLVLDKGAQGGDEPKATKVSVFVADSISATSVDNRPFTFKYIYTDLRNHYMTDVKHPLLAGLELYMEEGVGSSFGNKIRQASGRNLHIATVHSTQYFSLWSFMLCAATPFIGKVRINSLRDVLYYQKNVEYPFTSTLISMRDVRTKAYSNFDYTDYDTELSAKVMRPAAALSWTMPELYQRVGVDSSSKLYVLLPWYSCENNLRDGTWDDDASTMAFPSIRSGVRFAQLDALYGMTERDVRLALDMVSSFRSLGETSYLPNTLAYKYSVNTDGQIVLRASPGKFSVRAIMKLPRALGYVMTAPYGTLTPNYSHKRSFSASALGTSSFVCKYWTGEGPTEYTYEQSPTQAILSNKSVNINRAANFKQQWYAILASGTTPPWDHGIVMSMRQILSAAGAAVKGASSFNPYKQINGTSVTVEDVTNPMLSYQKAMWTRIQKLPFCISPFEGTTQNNNGTASTQTISDPFELLYYFGLGGFRASDFRESVYNRERKFVHEGYLFVSDPWIEQSPIFREGAVASGIPTAAGFEM